MRKKGIRYLRFSSDGQSHSSIERQELYTSTWFERNDVTLVDTFIDDGYSAKTFDRPDFKKLQEFIFKHHRQVDYLVVDQLDRFSRDAGEAIVKIKQLQKKYSIQIVSVTEGITYDYHTPGSFFRTGLQLLLAEENNIDRMLKINGGIYTAKAKEGRYIGGHPPYGYSKEGTGKERKLVIIPEQAAIIRYIFNAYLQRIPIYIIQKEISSMGCKIRGNSIIPRILANPIYAGYQYVKEFKQFPGGLFPAIHEAIIDKETWQLVQDKIKGPVKTKAILTDQFPLRGLLKCHCGIPLTGAPSRGKQGKYFDYYKCRKSQHTNISAKTAHGQLEEILQLMSLPGYLVKAISDEANLQLKDRMQENKKELQRCHRELGQSKQQLSSLEEKWINNQVNFDTYSRWHGDLTGRIFQLQAQEERFSRDAEQTWLLLQEELEKLTDLKYLYSSITTTERQELLRIVFDNGLYYRKPCYRTPYVMPVFTHNALEMKEKQLLIIDGWNYHELQKLAWWSSGGHNRTLDDLLGFIHSIKVA